MVVAAHQELTREWWETRSGRFDLLVSELVREEAVKGDEEASERRLAAVTKLPIPRATDLSLSLAERPLQGGPLPHEAGADALHIAIAAVNGVEHLLTWNCRHLANATLRDRIEGVVEEAGYGCPVICTPEQLMEDEP